MNIVKYSELVHMADTRSQARASSPYDTATNPGSFIAKCNNNKFICGTSHYAAAGFETCK